MKVTTNSTSRKGCAKNFAAFSQARPSPAAARFGGVWGSDRL